MPGVSENIEVRSIIGRFLEHTRVYAFHNKGNDEVFASSADLMDRNMFRRVEICFPIESKQPRKRILKELNAYLLDNSQSWILQSDGRYKQLEVEDDASYQVQQELLNELT